MQRVLHRKQPKQQGRFKFKVRQLGTSQMAGNLIHRRGQNVGWLKHSCLWGYQNDGKSWEDRSDHPDLCESKLIFTCMLYVYNSILCSTFAFCHQSSFIRTLSSLSTCTCFGIRKSLGWLSINPEAQPELRLDDANGSCWEPWKVKRHVGVPTKLIK